MVLHYALGISPEATDRHECAIWLRKTLDLRSALAKEGKELPEDGPTSFNAQLISLLKEARAGSMPLENIETQIIR